MDRRRSRTIAAVIAVGAIAFSSVAGASVAATEPETEGAAVAGVTTPDVPSTAVTVTAAAPSEVVPGSVNRTSPFLDATYDASLKIGWGARTITVDSMAVIRNTSGGPIDRVELNTIAARLGAIKLNPVTVDGATVAATVSDQTILVPLGGVLPDGGTTTIRVRFGATVRSTLSGSNWLFTRANNVLDLYRWLPWVSRRIAFTRPNHGDPFETPMSRLVKVRITTSRKLVLATTGDRTAISANGLVQSFIARDVRDFTVTASPDYRIKTRMVGGTQIKTYYRPGAPGAKMLDAAADAFAKLRARLGPYPYPSFKVVQSAGGYGMESPRLIWIPTGVASSNLRYLATHETAHQWFYGLVGNDQANEPFDDEAAADFAARSVLGMRRGSRCATARLDRRIYDYSSKCYYETIYIQGGNLLDDARKAMGSTAFWAAMRGYLADNRGRIVPSGTLLQALDAATPVDLAGTLFARRFPRLY